MTREEKNKGKQNEIIVEEKRDKRKKGVLISFGILGLIIILFLVFYFINIYTTSIVIVRENRIIEKNLPDEFNGLKIIQFSDLEYGSTIHANEVKSLVKLINSRNPDLVVFTGDLIDSSYKIDSKELEKLSTEFGKINSTLGKYAVIGDEDKNNVISVFNQSNFTILNNDSDLIYKNSNNPILLVGVSSLLSKSNNYDKAYNYFNQETYNSNIFTISLIHEPDMTDEILNKYRSNLILAGHSHNGYIRFPGGKSFSKIKGAKKYDQDFYKVGDSNLFISSGIGTDGNGIRIFCQPSLNFFRISNK